MVCTANICRSPVAEHALKGLQPALQVGSAGVDALVGHDIDGDARDAAAALGLDIPAHRARQLDAELGRSADLILVMERHHRDYVGRHLPQLQGKTFLIGEFAGIPRIPDPYKQGKAMHIRAAELIMTCARHWSQQLENMRQ